MPYEAKVGDFVSWKDADKVRYGAVTAASQSSITVKPYKKKTDGSEDSGITGAASALSDLQKSSWARMKFKAKPNMIEVAENAVVASGFHALIMKNKLFGAENMSFLIADTLHEFLTKNMAASMADMFKPYQLTEESGAIFQTADIWDSAQKLPFVTILQQGIQKFVFRKQLNHQLMSNLLGNAGIFYLSNIGDRMWYGDDAKTPAYEYK